MLVNVIGQILTIAEQLEFKYTENYEKKRKLFKAFWKNYKIILNSLQNIKVFFIKI